MEFSCAPKRKRQNSESEIVECPICFDRADYRIKCQQEGCSYASCLECIFSACVFVGNSQGLDGVHSKCVYCRKLQPIGKDIPSLLRNRQSFNCIIKHQTDPSILVLLFKEAAQSRVGLSFVTECVGNETLLYNLPRGTDYDLLQESFRMISRKCVHLLLENLQLRQNAGIGFENQQTLIHSPSTNDMNREHSARLNLAATQQLPGNDGNQLNHPSDIDIDSAEPRLYSSSNFLGLLLQRLFTSQDNPQQ